jgi:hypothetical protein
VLIKLRNILQVFSPIRMNVVVSLSIPLDHSVSEERVSESAQGPLIGRLRSYLDPGRKIQIENEAVRILFLPICFSNGVIQIPGSHSSQSRSMPRGENHSKSDPYQGTRPEVSTPCEPRSASGPPWSPDLVAPERTIRRDLMNPASKYDLFQPSWILVAEKPTDEALRQGRNPSTSELEVPRGIGRRATTICTSLYTTPKGYFFYQQAQDSSHVKVRSLTKPSGTAIGHCRTQEESLCAY